VLGILIPTTQIISKGYHMTSKKGIFCHSLWSSLIELRSPLKSGLAIFLRQWPGMEKMDTLQEQINKVSKDLGDFFPEMVRKSLKPSTCLRRLALVRDPAGKTRIVAIFDYWTQVALRPLHLYVLKHLGVWFKGCDMAKNQNGFDPSLPKGPIYSFDLSSATDRLPMEFQKEIMVTLIGFR